MNLKLPDVDVFLTVGDDGTLMLLVGGFATRLKPDELADVLRGKKLKNGPRPSVKKAKPKAELSFAEKRAKHAAARNKKGLCTWCGEKAKPGKKLCGSHLLVLSKNRAKKKAAGKAAA